MTNNRSNTSHHEQRKKASTDKQHQGAVVQDLANSQLDAPSESVHVSAHMFSMRLFDAEKDLPIVYAPEYNMTMAGVQLLHQFDTQKYAKIVDILNASFQDTRFVRSVHRDDLATQEAAEEHRNPPRRLRLMKPNRPINSNELQKHHTWSYIDTLMNDKSLIARITEVWILNLVPMCLIETKLLNPIKWQVSGTIFATCLAMQHGWAINLGGGFHGASASSGETFCVFSDVLLAIRYVWRKHPLQKFMIIDLDAHQAVGIERDLAEMEQRRRKMIFMVDMFNNSIQPPDQRADQGIDVRVELGRFTGDDTYLQKLDETLRVAYAKFKPTLVIYIAGQDCLKEDQLGLMNISDDGLKKRDEMVFSWATEKHRCPILMLLGGGYHRRGLRVQAESIKNLFARNLIWGGHRSGSRSLSRPRRRSSSKDKHKHKHKHSSTHHNHHHHHHHNEKTKKDNPPVKQPHEAQPSTKPQTSLAAKGSSQQVKSCSNTIVPSPTTTLPATAVIVPANATVSAVPVVFAPPQLATFNQTTASVASQSNQLNSAKSGTSASSQATAPLQAVESSSRPVPRVEVVQAAPVESKFLKRLREEYNPDKNPD